MSGKSGVKVEREPFEYNGKTYYDYYIAGKIRGVDVKVKLGPPDTKDKGGYTVLDIVYGNETQADFITEPFEFVSADGKTVASPMPSYECISLFLSTAIHVVGSS